MSVALVTGGGRGIGRAIALGLAEDGFDVAFTYRRDATAAEVTAAEIAATGRWARAYATPAADDPDVAAAVVADVIAERGGIDVLVNNAGVASRGLRVTDTDPVEPARVIAAHAIGAHHLCRLAVPSMRARGGGSIVMISSIATRDLGAFGAPYNMAKAALEALAMTLAHEEPALRVNVVAPGLVDTDMGRRLVRATRGLDDIRALDATAPLGRVCQPEDVARTVRFLVSPAGEYVNGQRIYVDGGRAEPWRVD